MWLTVYIVSCKGKPFYATTHTKFIVDSYFISQLSKRENVSVMITEGSENEGIKDTPGNLNKLHGYHLVIFGDVQLRKTC